MAVFQWVCPYCLHHASIGNSNFSSSLHHFHMESKHGSQAIYSTVIVCPNPSCKETTLKAVLYKTQWTQGNGTTTKGAPLEEWKLKPDSMAKVMPDYIPTPINADYIEACKISHLSPKASATLSRRCLQGILRDYWKVKPSTLFNEIAEIKDKVDPLTWDAIEAVRTVGNIGAHMEHDINLIVDVDPQEAEALIGLIELLIQDWYVTRFERSQRLHSITAIAQDKKTTKKQQ